MPKEGVDSMGNKLMVRMLLISDQMCKIAPSGKESTNPQPLAAKHKQKGRIHKKMAIL